MAAFADQTRHDTDPNSDFAPRPGAIPAAAARLRAELTRSHDVARAAASIAQVSRTFSQASDPLVRETVAAIADRRGWSTALVQASLAALWAPLADAHSLALIGHRLESRAEVIGFIMPGNIPGGGLHEVMLTLLTGRAALLKASVAEVAFFDGLAQLLEQIAPDLAARLVMFRWPRAAETFTRSLLESSDRVVALGSDETLDRLAAIDQAIPLSGFGSRISGAFVSSTAADAQTARRLATDIVLFEQCGCLSPHHIFVVDRPSGRAEAFAALLAEAIAELTVGPLPPARRVPLEAAAQIRGLREDTRWRATPGRVRLWEGRGSTVIFDRDASFRVSPGYRTVFVSAADNLAQRLATLPGRLEAFAVEYQPRLDDPDEMSHARAILRASGASYLCKAGTIHQPPLDWPHGGGAFLRALGAKP